MKGWTRAMIGCWGLGLILGAASWIANQKADEVLDSYPLRYFIWIEGTRREAHTVGGYGFGALSLEEREQLPARGWRNDDEEEPGVFASYRMLYAKSQPVDLLEGDLRDHSGNVIRFDGENMVNRIAERIAADRVRPRRISDELQEYLLVRPAGQLRERPKHYSILSAYDPYDLEFEARMIRANSLLGWRAWSKRFKLTPLIFLAFFLLGATSLLWFPKVRGKVQAIVAANE